MALSDWTKSDPRMRFALNNLAGENHLKHTPVSVEEWNHHWKECGTQANHNAKISEDMLQSLLKHIPRTSTETDAEAEEFNADSGAHGIRIDQATGIAEYYNRPTSLLEGDWIPVRTKEGQELIKQIAELEASEGLKKQSDELQIVHSDVEFDALTETPVRFRQGATSTAIPDSDNALVTRAYVDEVVQTSGVGIPEAPIDNKQYIRKDADWVELQTPQQIMDLITNLEDQITVLENQITTYEDMLSAIKNGSDLEPGSIKSTHISDNAVTTNKIAYSSITKNRFAPDAESYMLQLNGYLQSVQTKLQALGQSPGTPPTW